MATGCPFDWTVRVASATTSSKRSGRARIDSKSRQRKDGTAGFLRAPPDGVEAVGIVHGEGAQDVSVENPEDGRYEAHADGQR